MKAHTGCLKSRLLVACSRCTNESPQKSLFFICMMCIHHLFPIALTSFTAGLCSSKPSMWQTMRLALKSKRTGYFLDRTFVWHQLVPGHDVCIVSLYAVYEGQPETKTIPITFSHLEEAGWILTPTSVWFPQRCCCAKRAVSAII